MQRQKNIKVQMLRGIAIVAVILIHTLPAKGDWQFICRPPINFAVALFIFLSGYLTKFDNNDWGLFCRKRIIRVIIPYIIWTVIYTLPLTDPKRLLSFLVSTKAASQLYYIFVYIQFVLLTPLLGKLAKSRYRWAGWLIAPIAIISYKYTTIILNITPPSYISTLWGISCLGWFTYYYLGLLLGNGALHVTSNWKRITTLYALSIILQIAEGYVWYHVFDEKNCGTQVKLSCIITSTIFLLMSYFYISDDKIQLKSKALLTLGEYSFGIYLSHILVVRLLYHFASWYPKLPFLINSSVIILASLALVYSGRLICGKTVSRWIGLE